MGGHLRKITPVSIRYEKHQIPRYLGYGVLRNALSVLDRLFGLRDQLSVDRGQRLGRVFRGMEQNGLGAADARFGAFEFLVRGRQRRHRDDEPKLFTRHGGSFR